MPWMPEQWTPELWVRGPRRSTMTASPLACLRHRYSRPGSRTERRVPIRTASALPQVSRTGRSGGLVFEDEAAESVFELGVDPCGWGVVVGAGWQWWWAWVGVAGGGGGVDGAVGSGGDGPAGCLFGVVARLAGELAVAQAGGSAEVVVVLA